MTPREDRVERLMAFVDRMPDQDVKIVMAIVHLLAHTPEAKVTPFADLWELCSGEKLDAETRAQMDAIDREHRPGVNQ